MLRIGDTMLNSNKKHAAGEPQMLDVVFLLAGFERNELGLSLRLSKS